MPCQLLNRVIDSLQVRIGAKCYPSIYFRQVIKDWRKIRAETAANKELPTVELPGLGTFKLLSHGSSRYEIVLINDRICTIRIIELERWSEDWAYETGQIYVSFRSEYLQHCGPDAAIAYLKVVRGLFMAQNHSEGYMRASRVDCTTDFQMPAFFSESDLGNFVTKARTKDLYYDQLDPLRDLHRSLASPLPNNKGGSNHTSTATYTLSQVSGTQAHQVLGKIIEALESGADISRVCAGNGLETIYFGKKTSPVYCRVYDKTREIRKSGKDYMRDIWLANGWDGVSVVIRVEFSLAGDFLKNLNCKLPAAQTEDGLISKQPDLRDIEICMGIVPSIWKYLTHHWLRHCDRGKQGQEWRWKTSELWQAVQGAWQDAEAVQRTYPIPKPTCEQLDAQIMGCIKTKIALNLPTAGVDGGAHAALTDIVDGLGRHDFEDACCQRAAERGYDSSSDAVMSAQIRQEEMSWGNGS